MIRNCWKIIKLMYGVFKTKFIIKRPKKYIKIIDSPIINRGKKWDFSKNRVDNMPMPKEIKRTIRFIPQNNPESVSKIIANRKIRKNK